VSRTGRRSQNVLATPRSSARRVDASAGSAARRSRYGRSDMSALSQERDDSVPSFNTIVLVEGISDRIAVEALAERRHRNLAAEELDVRRGLERAGFSHDLTRADMERLGFFVCIADLEDELIRALGAASVETVLEAHGDLRSFRTLQKQPAWRGRSTEQQLRR